MKSLVFILLSVSGLGVSGSEAVAQIGQNWAAPPEADTLSNPYGSDADLLQVGKDTYGLLCWLCHGEKGLGNGPARTGLQVQPTNFTLERVQAQSDGALFWKMSTGNPPMMAYEAVLSEKQRWALVAFIRTLAQH
jgi:mono/diheme cytochrome c family protein